VEQGRSVILVTSAAIAVGLQRMRRRRRPRDLSLLQAAASLGQSRLMHLYETAFQRFDVQAAQVLLTLEDIQDRARYLNIRNTILALWKVPAVPVINENDAVSYAEIVRFGDNDVLGAHIANMMDADLYLMLTDREGLYREDPRVNPEAEVIREVSEITPEILQAAGGEGSEFSATHPFFSRKSGDDPAGNRETYC
jgi:glutamate 5-kinase